MDYRLMPENPWGRFARGDRPVVRYGRSPAQEDKLQESPESLQASADAAAKALAAQGRNLFALTAPNPIAGPVNTRNEQLRREARRIKTSATMLTPDQYDVAVANTLATEPYQAVQAANKNMEDYIQRYGGMPSQIDLSPMAAGLGLNPNLVMALKPHETQEEKNYKMIAALDKIQNNRMDLLKTAASSVAGQKGGLLTDFLTAQTIGGAGFKPLMPRFNPEGKAPIGDFVKRYESSPVMKGYYNRQGTMELADTLIAEDTANAYDQLKYIAATHFDRGGRLSDQDFNRAGGGDKSISGMLKSQYLAWKNNKVLPKNMEYMTRLIGAMKDSDERLADDYARRLSTTAPKFFRGNIPPEELYYSLRPEGDWGTSETAKQQRKKTDEIQSKKVEDAQADKLQKELIDAIKNYKPEPKRNPQSVPPSRFRLLLDALRGR